MTDLVTALIICLFTPAALALKVMLRRIIDEADERSEKGGAE